MFCCRLGSIDNQSQGEEEDVSKENTATDFDRELANLAASDLKVIDELSGWLSAYYYEVNVCGRNGIIERERCESLARVVIKRLSNFL